jgi:probable rRNA maturation factor
VIARVKLSLSRHDRCAGKRIPWLDRATIERLRRAAADLGPEDALVDVVIVDDAYIRDLNRDYRGIDRPTDVISFSYTGDEHPPGPSDDVAGEVYVSYETLDDDARSKGIAPEHLFLRLGVHGLLHVLGHDHTTRAESSRMESEEKRLLMDYLDPSEVEQLF